MTEKLSTSLAIKFIGFLIFFAIGIFSLEIGLRIIENFRLQDPLFEQYKKIYQENFDKPYLYQHQPNINIKLEKSYYEFTMITNSDGLREERDFSNLKKSIIFLGDSIVEGASVENHETMSSIITEATGITTLNFGVGNSNTVQEYFYLQDKLRPDYNAKLIILGFCLNDLEQNRYRRAFDSRVGNWRWFDEVDGYRESLPGNGEQVFINRNQETAEQLNISLFARFKRLIGTPRVLLLLSELVKPSQVATDDPFRDPKISPDGLRMTQIYINKLQAFAKKMEQILLL